jgi:hypothetical protein
VKWKHLGDSKWASVDGRFTIEPVGYQWERKRSGKYDYFLLTEVPTDRKEHGNSTATMKRKAEAITKESANVAIQESERERSVRRAALLEQLVHKRADRIEPEGLRDTCKNPDEEGSVLAYPFDSVRTSASEVFMDGEG